MSAHPIQEGTCVSLHEGTREFFYVVLNIGP